MIKFDSENDQQMNLVTELKEDMDEKPNFCRLSILFSSSYY